MDHKHDETLKAPPKRDEARRLRLGAELRANLKKRKDRARALVRAGRAKTLQDVSK
jgi:hypothetical protein